MTRGMVASSQRLATDVGVGILRGGGNAADAAIAVAAALAVTEPCSTGLGGDCFALYFEAATGAITALNGSGRAPAALSLARLAADGLTELPRQHGHAVTVPGACDGWCSLLERHGSRQLAEVLAPAIALAEDGFAVAPLTAQFWQLGLERLAGAANLPQGSLHGAPDSFVAGPAPANLGELAIDGRAPRAGERFCNPGLARTLRAIAADGRDALYDGALADAIVAVVQGAGGVMSRDDLAAHRSTWDQPLSTTYRDLRIWECPPNGQGLAALLALDVLAGFDLGALDPLGAERWHLMIEALRLAFADARDVIADPALAELPIDALLTPAHAARRRAAIDPRRALATGAPQTSSDTVQFCVVDGAGNACSFVNSNYMGFGTGLVPRGAGFTLQNRGHGFSLDPAHRNALAPGKRPYHTIIPGLITRADGTLYGPFGVMGGFMQPQGHVQVVVAMLDDGVDPQAAVDRPRFCIDPVDGDGAVHLEDGVPDATIAALAAAGHRIVPGVTGLARALFGRGQIIRRDRDGTLTGGSDPRADGSVGVAE